MPILKVEDLRAQIQKRGYSWKANELPDGHQFHPLGNNRTFPVIAKESLIAAEKFLGDGTSGLALHTLAAHAMGVAAGPAAIPSSFDWCTQGVIGPVTDQERCGSCVSFATVGLPIP